MDSSDLTELFQQAGKETKACCSVTNLFKLVSLLNIFFVLDSFLTQGKLILKTNNLSNQFEENPVDT